MSTQVYVENSNGIRQLAEIDQVVHDPDKPEIYGVNNRFLVWTIKFKEELQMLPIYQEIRWGLILDKNDVLIHIGDNEVKQ